MTRSETRDRQAGFSLIELMIAMVATMVIAGAVFELVNAGNSAFRREPGLADRQQNIRMAMNVISEDILRAGFAMPQFQQVFSNGLDGVGPTGSSGQGTDEIELIAASDCGVMPVCASPGANIVTNEGFNSCFSFPAVVILVDTQSDPQDSGVYWVMEPGSGGGSNKCGGSTAGGKNGHVVMPHGQSVLNPPGGPGFDPNFILVGSMARYRINLDADGVPNLERSNTGGVDVGAMTWETIARGIEDLQVEYLNGTGWNDEPGNVGCGPSAVTCANPAPADYDTIVQKVRIRLSARALVNNIQGQTANAAVGDAARGEMVSEISPRAAQIAVGQGNGEV